jgi:hypothetical protein
MQCGFIAIVTPSDGELAFLLALQKRRIHCRPDEPALYACDLTHRRYSSAYKWEYGGRDNPDHAGFTFSKEFCGWRCHASRNKKPGQPAGFFNSLR